MNVWDYVILVLVAGALLFAVRRVKRANGRCSCGRCSSCTRHCARDAK